MYKRGRRDQGGESETQVEIFLWRAAGGIELKFVSMRVSAAELLPDDKVRACILHDDL